MGVILDSMPPGNSRTELEERDAIIVEAVRNGKGEYQWYPIRITDKKNTVTVYVMTDALKIEGVRVNVSATAEQQVADILNAVLLTPYLADVTYEMANVKLSPSPQKIMATTQAMIDHSERVDKRIGQRSGLVADVGKDWVLVNQLAKGTKKLSAGTVACNYGWHVPISPWGGIHSEVTVDRMGYVIQGVGLAHDRTHVDYSQVCRLASREAKWNSNKYDLRAIMTDSATAGFVSSEGTMLITRQPGVPEEPIGQVVASVFPVSPVNEELGLPIRYV